MIKHIELMATAAACLALVLPHTAIADSSCPLGYTVGYFNGVGNTFVDALASQHTTEAMIDESQGRTDRAFDSEDVDYAVYYNQTGSNGANTSVLQDIAEVFIQRAKDIDPSGGVGQNQLYLFWEWLDGPPQNYSRSAGTLETINNFITKYQNAAVALAVSKLASLFSSPPTAADYAQQETDLTTAANAGRKLLLVAHSQGNLFVNHAYDFIQPVVGSPRVKVVHVAPASVTLRGAYELSDKDIVINGLRAAGGTASVVNNNVSPAFLLADPSGHGFGEVYASSSLIDANTGTLMRTLLTSKLIAGLTAMDQQQCTLTITPPSDTVNAGGQVALTATLTPALNSAHLASVTYKWVISGNAGGYFTNPVTGGAVTSTITTVPNVTYNAANDAITGQIDSVVVEEDVGTANNNNSTSKDLADTKNAPATITIGGVKIVLSPVSPTVAPSSTTTFTGTVTGDLPSGATYQWTLVGTGSIGASPVTTPTPTIGYTAPATAPTSGGDVLSLSVLSPAGVILGKTSTTVTIQANPWVGTWVGSVASTCGYYSGPLTLYITSTGVNTLGLSYIANGFTGGYPLTIDPNNPNVAQYNNSEVVNTINGNTMTAVEPDSCQSGSYSKQ